MRLFGKCIWHRWRYKIVAYDYTDICVWSNGIEKYRQCEDCGITQIKVSVLKNDDTDPIIFWKNTSHKVF